MKLLSTLLLFIVITILINQSNCDQFNNEKISQSVNNRILYSTDVGNIPKLWVFFNSKGISIIGGGGGGDVNKSRNSLNSNKFIDLNNGKEIEDVKSYSGINDKSIERRLKSSINKNAIIDETDLPVSQKFIDQILSCGSEIKLVQKSKWLNSISISIQNNANNNNNIDEIKSTINCIVSKSFVDKVDIVTKFKKETVMKHDDENKINQSFSKLYNSKLLLKNEEEKEQQEQELSNSYGREFYGNTFDAVSQVGIDKLQSLGFDGYGVTVLMLDSGFYKSHEAFKDLKIIGEHNFIDGSNDTQSVLGDSQNNHGTATLSTIAGYMPGIMIGAAYNASYLLGKTEIVSSESIIEEDYWIAAIEWGEGLGAQVVSSSLGYTQWYNYYDLDATKSHITSVADFATTKGMVVVVSGGNSGLDGIGAPADGKHVIAVGAMVNETGINTGFSSIGPSSDGRVKPDIMALGYKNYVAHHVSKSSYTTMSGTSFACPLAASGIALLIQARPEWSNYQIYEAVLGSASRALSPNIRTGFGTFNAYQAYLYKQSANKESTCDEIGCSGHGGCCNGKCVCAPTHYGPFCQYERVKCSYECLIRKGKCQMDKFGLSFICVEPNNTQISNYDPREVCSVCSGSQFDKCGVCGGSNQCFKFINSFNNHHYSRKSIILQDDTIENSNKKIKLIIGVSVGGVASILFIVFSVFIYRRNNNNNNNNNRNNTPTIIFPFLRKSYSSLEKDAPFSISE